MTEPRNSDRTGASGRARSGMPARRRPRLVVTALAALAGFFVVFELLAFQLRAGADPAIGQGQPLAAVAQGSHARVISSQGTGSSSSTLVSTRTSGAAAVAPPPASSPGLPSPPGMRASAPGHRARPVRTRTSGGSSHRAGRGDGEREMGDVS